MEKDRKEKVALWRLGVLGPLISAPARARRPGRSTTRWAAERVHEHPDGRLVRLSARTVEDWYRAYRRGGFSGLFPGDRADLGQSRAIDAEVADMVLRAKQERPRRSIRRIIRMLERGARRAPGPAESVECAPGYCSLTASRGDRCAAPEAERRSFIMEHAGDLWDRRRPARPPR
jgi:hypothetical protein